MANQKFVDPSKMGQNADFVYAKLYAIETKCREEHKNEK